MARFAKFGKKEDKKILSASRLPSITPAYTRPETNKKVDVPRNVTRQIVNGAADALKSRLAEELGKGGIHINLKEARVVEEANGPAKDIKKASLGFEVEVSTRLGKKVFGALVEYDSRQTRSKQYVVAPSLLFGETKAAFRREEIEKFLSEKPEFKKVAVFYDPGQKRYRCLGEATDELMDSLRTGGHYVRARYIDETIVKGHKSEGFEVIPLEESLPEMRKMAGEWEDRASEKHPNVSDSELLPSLPTPGDKEWEERASEKGKKITDSNMLKMEQKKDAQADDEEELEEEIEEAESETEEASEEAEEAEEEIAEELEEEAPIEEPSATPAEQVIEDAAEQVKNILEDAAEDIKEEAVEEIREEVTEQVEQEVKQQVQQEVMDAIDEAISGTPAEEAVEEIMEEPAEETIEEEFVDEAPESGLTADKKETAQQQPMGNQGIDLPGGPDVTAPAVEPSLPAYIEVSYVVNGKKETKTYKQVGDEYITEEELPEGMPKSFPANVAPTMAKKEDK